MYSTATIRRHEPQSSVAREASWQRLIECKVMVGLASNLQSNGTLFAMRLAETVSVVLSSVGHP